MEQTNTPKTPPASPLPQTKTAARQYTFYEALKSLAEGKKIHKLEWGDKEFYGVLKDNFVMLHKDDGKFYSWIISEADMTGKDWVII